MKVVGGAGAGYPGRPAADVMNLGGAPASARVDLLELAAIAQAASSAAASTAHTVDLVVQEALLFFSSIAPTARPPGDRGRGVAGAGPEDSAELFRTFGERATADARAAAQACNMTHQLVAAGGGGAADSPNGGNAVAIALAAARVGNHADRTAATAREAAQLCMGILEEAVQASAGPLARETAKRCAEQALRSIETVNVAEQHNRSLSELLALVLPAMPGPGAPALGAPPQPGRGAAKGAAKGAGRGEAKAAGRGARQEELRMDARGDAPEEEEEEEEEKEAEEDEDEQEQEENEEDAPAPAAAAPPPSFARRWWDVEHPRDGLESAASAASPQSGGGPAPSGRSPAALEAHLESCCLRAMSEAGTGPAEPAEEEDKTEGAEAPAKSEDLSVAVRAIVEWRYGASLALGRAEAALLSDGEVGRLASWGRGGADAPLPEELLRAACRGGPEGFQALATALRGATRRAQVETGTSLSKADARPAGEAAKEDGGVEAFLGAFRHRSSLEELLGGAPASEEDWGAAFERLGWCAPARAGAARGARPALGAPSAQQLQETAIASIRAWEASGVPGAQSEVGTLQDPLDEDWSVDDLTAKKLQKMAMYSRSKQRRAGTGKHKTGGGAGGGAGAAGDGGSQLPTTGIEDEREVRALLREVLGDLESPEISADPPQPTGASAAFEQRAPARQPQQQQHPRPQQDERRGEKGARKGGGRKGAAVGGSSQQLARAPGRRPQEGDAEERGEKEPGFQGLQPMGGGWGAPFMPLGQGLQQRLPGAFDEGFDGFGEAMGRGVPSAEQASPAGRGRPRAGDALAAREDPVYVQQQGAGRWGDEAPRRPRREEGRGRGGGGRAGGPFGAFASMPRFVEEQGAPSVGLAGRGVGYAAGGLWSQQQHQS